MLANSSGGAMTQYDVITVAAMEGVGVAAAMQQQQAISGVHQALPTCFYQNRVVPFTGRCDDALHT